MSAARSMNSRSRPPAALGHLDGEHVTGHLGSGQLERIGLPVGNVALLRAALAVADTE